MDLLLYLAGGVLLVALVRSWRREPSWRIAAGYLLAVALFFAVPLTTRAFQVPTDIAYHWRPWVEMIPRPELEPPRNDLLSDIPLQMLPFRTLVRGRLLRGEIPLWAHETGTGQPLAGNAQSAPLAPLHLMALARPPLRALTVAVAWQVLLGLLLMHALLRALGAGAVGSVFGAAAFAFSLYAICWAYHPLGMTTMWVPGVLLGVVALARDEPRALPGLLVCAFGLAASGHPETVAFTALAAALLVALLAWRRRSAGLGPLVFRFGLATVLAASLCAPVLLPIVAALPESSRAASVESHPDGVEPPPFRAETLATVIDPLILGSPRDLNWRGPLDTNFNELTTGYAGIVPLALALAVALLLRGRLMAVLLGGAAALLAAMRVEPFFWMARLVPGLEHAAHARLRLFWVLAVAVAAGLGFERLLRHRRGPAVAAATLAAAAAALVLLPPPHEPWQRAWWVAAVVGAVGSAGALLVGRLRPAVPAILLIALATDLALLHGRYLPVVPSRYDLEPPPAALELMARTAAEGQPVRVLAEGADLKANLGALYGLWDPRGDDPMLPQAAALVVGRSFHRLYRSGRVIYLSPEHYPQPVLDALGVRYLLTRHRRTPPPPWESVWNGQGGRIWRNPRAFSLFFMPAAVRGADAAAALATTLSNPDFAAQAMVEEQPAVETMVKANATPAAPAGEPPAPLVPQRGRVERVRQISNGFVIDVDSPSGGVVASSVSWSRGWRLTLDGSPVEWPTPLRVNAGFVGFRVPPGRHRAVLLYCPGGWLWGARLGVAGVILAGLVAVGAGRWRAPFTPRAKPPAGAAPAL
jgi:hypothetical protein